MNNSSNLIVLRDMVRDLSYIQDLALNSDISWSDYLTHVNAVFNRVGLELGTIDEREITCEGGCGQEVRETLQFLRNYKRDPDRATRTKPMMASDAIATGDWRAYNSDAPWFDFLEWELDPDYVESQL